MFFELFATAIFGLAIIHFFFSNHLLKQAHLLHQRKSKNTFAMTGLSFLGNPALIFGIWLVPLLVVMAIREGGSLTYDFLTSVNLVEPFAYFVIVAIATIHPLQNLVHTLMQKMSRLFKNQLLFFWAGLILFSSILTGLFSEIGIMTLVCTQLSLFFFFTQAQFKTHLFYLRPPLSRDVDGNDDSPFKF